MRAGEDSFRSWLASAVLVPPLLAPLTPFLWPLEVPCRPPSVTHTFPPAVQDVFSQFNDQRSSPSAAVSEMALSVFL